MLLYGCLYSKHCIIKCVFLAWRAIWESKPASFTQLIEQKYNLVNIISFVMC